MDAISNLSKGSTTIMQEITSAIDSLRREVRHDLREMRAIVQQLTEVISESGKDVVKVEGQVALMEQKCEAITNKLVLLKAEIDVIDADVSRLKQHRSRLIGSWQAITVVAVVAASASQLLIKAFS